MTNNHVQYVFTLVNNNNVCIPEESIYQANIFVMES